MRSATNFERAEGRLRAVAPYAFVSGLVAGALLLAALWWLWPGGAAAAGALLLIACGWQIVVLRRQVRAIADRDPLTGVASRSCFARALERAVHESSRFGTPVSVAVLDCDDFKRLNEQLGHAAGDAVLIEVADVLSQLASPPGVVARLWGDAFGILLPGASLEAARELLREADRRLRARMDRHGWPVTFSVGISCCGGDVATAEALLADADALMFAVKRRGRNGIASRDRCEESRLATDAPSPEFARQP
ncbi:MAG TPA: GGDEF domain-containing protein [Planctomycetaceae bacterium]|nr:GGDEF domain-containing protein [Planctomycetaceae bacterium]